MYMYNMFMGVYILIMKCTCSCMLPVPVGTSYRVARLPVAGSVLLLMLVLVPGTGSIQLS
jgi:hypothetical protein